MEMNGDLSGIRPVPLDRVRQKLDELMGRRDPAGAERLLLYWLREALAGGDRRGELSVRNELIGHYRKTADREKALPQIREALALLKALDLDGTVTAGTTRINAATTLTSFGEHRQALALFRAAAADYGNGEGVSPALLGGLNNNMGLCCAALGLFEEALACFDRAMEQMSHAPGGRLEQAVTCLNRADALTAQLGAEAAEGRVTALLEQAEALLDAPDLSRDGYYAFVCEKCAPVFGYYGFFLTEKKLRETAEAIYERA